MSKDSDRLQSPDTQWRGFTYTLLFVSVVIPAVLYLFIAVVDPYDNLPVSPNWARLQVTGTHRFYKPSVARRPEYDGVVIGASTSMMLHPGRLGKALDARFANLAMPAASPFEQLRLLQLFHAHHPSPRFVLLGLDRIWCDTDGTPKQIGANVGRPDPVWLYDENYWNDWPGLSPEALKHARRQARALLNADEDPAAYDGYYNFTIKSYGPYDLQRARKHIYGGLHPLPRPQDAPPLEIDPETLQGWAFPDLVRLQEALERLPVETVKLVFFTPFHWYQQAQPGTREQAEMTECKRRVAAIGAWVRNYFALDFMRRTPITLIDSNYWDGMHFTTEIAQSVEGMLANVIKGGRGDNENYTYLVLPSAPMPTTTH
jgi:hypothetical protein